MYWGGLSAANSGLWCGPSVVRIQPRPDPSAASVTHCWTKPASVACSTVLVSSRNGKAAQCWGDVLLDYLCSSLRRCKFCWSNNTSSNIASSPLLTCKTTWFLTSINWRRPSRLFLDFCYTLNLVRLTFLSTDSSTDLDHSKSAQLSVWKHTDWDITWYEDVFWMFCSSNYFFSHFIVMERKRSKRHTGLKINVLPMSFTDATDSTFFHSDSIQTWHYLEEENPEEWWCSHQPAALGLIWCSIPIGSDEHDAGLCPQCAWWLTGSSSHLWQVM